MARHEADREDLLREATALVDRVELNVPELAEPVVVGFRRNGCGSVFFGEDPAVHFNAANQLRRAYVAGRLLKAEQGNLVALTRNRAADEVQLIREDWGTEQTGQFLNDLTDRLNHLHQALQADACRIIGQVTERDDLLARIDDWLALLVHGIQIADRPNVE